MDFLLSRNVGCITVLDISRAALDRAAARLGPAASRVRWIESDVTAAWSIPAVDIWHDRAVFHFLVDASGRQRYREKLFEVVRPGGSAIIATFALEGPDRCSGLPIVRYSPDSLSAELGGGLRLMEAVRESHTTPSGITQEFWYCRFTLP